MLLRDNSDESQPRRASVIIDTDPGVDDALTILAAFNDSCLEVVGLTTMFGNVTVERSTHNALLLCELAGRSDVPVAQGAAGPLTSLMKPVQTFDFVHGADGLGNTNNPGPSGKAHPLDAARFIVETAAKRPGEITLLCLAGLTNLALALQIDPDLDKKLKEVVFLGGAYFSLGNVNPAAEANVISDPEAADFVFSRCSKMRAIGLDVTEKCILTSAMLESLNGRGRFGSFARAITRFYEQFHQSSVGLNGIFLHDPTSLCFLIRPELFEVRRGGVVVVLEGPARGKTLLDNGEKKWHSENEWTRRPQVEVAISASHAKVVQQVIDWLTRPMAMPTTSPSKMVRGKSSCPTLEKIPGTHSFADLSSLSLSPNGRPREGPLSLAAKAERTNTAGKLNVV